MAKKKKAVELKDCDKCRFSYLNEIGLVCSLRVNNEVKETSYVTKQECLFFRSTDEIKKM
jgi:hypothetical protein